jgi:hypothetical protein
VVLISQSIDSLETGLTALAIFLKNHWSSFLSRFDKIGKPWPGFGPGTFALPRQRSTRLSYQGADTKRNLVMGLHLKHIELNRTPHGHNSTVDFRYCSVLCLIDRVNIN